LTKVNYSHHKNRCSVLKALSNGKNNNKIIYANKDKKNPTYFTKLKVSDIESLEIMPSNAKRERDIICWIGTSGQGKSYQINKYLEKLKCCKDNIYMFSSINDDPSITFPLKRIDLEKFVDSEELDYEDFEKSVLIFDDIDCISNTKIRKKLFNLINYLLFTGRHINCTLLITLHNPTNKGEAKNILNESHVVTLFMHSMGHRVLKYLLQDYLGLSSKQIKKLYKKCDDSGWVSVFKGSRGV
jgi:hypothetical protein